MTPAWQRMLKLNEDELRRVCEKWADALMSPTGFTIRLPLPEISIPVPEVPKTAWDRVLEDPFDDG